MLRRPVPGSYTRRTARANGAPIKASASRRVPHRYPALLWGRFTTPGRDVGPAHTHTHTTHAPPLLLIAFLLQITPPHTPQVAPPNAPPQRPPRALGAANGERDEQGVARASRPPLLDGRGRGAGYNNPARVPVPSYILCSHIGFFFQRVHCRRGGRFFLPLARGAAPATFSANQRGRRARPHSGPRDIPFLLITQHHTSTKPPLQITLLLLPTKKA